MTADHERQSASDIVPLTPPGASKDASTNSEAVNNGSAPALQAECERLRKRVQELEAECGGYHRSLMALLRERCAQTDTSTDADLDEMAAEALRMRDFDDELRQLLQER